MPACPQSSKWSLSSAHPCHRKQRRGAVRNCASQDAQVAVGGAINSIGMSRRVVARIVSFLVVALLWFAIPCAAGATEYPRELTLAEGTQSPDAGSQVALTSIVVLRYLPTFDEHEPDSTTPVDIGCVRFRNQDARTANHVVVRFSYLAADGSEVGADTLDMRGTFSRGAMIGTVPPVAPPRSWMSTVKTCREIDGFQWGGDGVRHAAYASGRRMRDVTIAASVREVGYNDGTSWRADP